MAELLVGECVLIVPSVTVIVLLIFLSLFGKEDHRRRAFKVLKLLIRHKAFWLVIALGGSNELFTLLTNLHQLGLLR